MNTINLFIKKSEVEDYLRYIFKANTSGPVEITRRHYIGRYIYSIIRYSEFPVKVKEMNKYSVVDLIIPSQERAKTSDFSFLYFRPEDIDRINDYLLADFNIFFRGFMLAGEEMHIDKKDLIESFMAGTGIKEVGKKYDTLKKKDYRHRKNIFQIMVDSLYSIGVQCDKKNNQPLSP